MESLITRFDTENPCWTSDVLARAGEDASLLPQLVNDGILHLEDEVYSLTETGAQEFERLSEEMFLGVKPGAAPADRKKSAARSRLRLLLDEAHSQRWGMKKYLSGVSLDVYPKLSREETFSLADGKLEWKYDESPVCKKMKDEVPTAFIDSRRTDMVPPEKLAAWLAANAAEPGNLDVDLLYLCYYDFMQYRDFTGHPNDPLKLINTDRFLFVFPEDDIAANVETVGKFHLWLNGLRRLFIPGYVDRDTQEQDSVSWLVFTTETESEAKALAEQLGAFGEELVLAANPCEVWTMSFEALENLDAKRELIWELLPDICHHAQRTVI